MSGWSRAPLSATLASAVVAVAVVVLLCLALIPVVPVSDGASATIKPDVAREATGTSGPSQGSGGARLLGENGAPPGAPQRGAQGGAQGRVRGNPPAPAASETMTLTIPKLELKDVPVPTGSTQKELDRDGVLHLAGSGVPWREGSNTFIAGHALGFTYTRVPYAFYKLDELKPGDEITVVDASGKSYTFRVFDHMTVRPEDYWVTYPTNDGRTVLSLQSCTPIPTFENRLIVRAELVG